MGASWVHYWIALAVVVAAAPVPELIGRNIPVPLSRPLDELSADIGDWRSTNEHLEARVLEKLGTDDILMRRYVDSRGDTIMLYISYFERQQQGEISHSPKNCLPGAGWQEKTATRIPYPVPRGEPGLINEIVFDKAGQEQLVYYWFQERGRVLASEYWVKWYLIWDVITRQHSNGALLRVSAPIHRSEQDTRDQLMRFMQVALPRVNELLPD